MLPVDPVCESAQRREASTLWAVAAVVCVRHRHGRKESMATAPLMVILYDRIFLFDSFREAAVAARGASISASTLTWLFLAFQLVAGRAQAPPDFRRPSLCGLPAESIRDDLPVLRLAAWPTDLVINVRRARRVHPFGCPPRIGDRRRVVVVTAAAIRDGRGAFLGAWFFMTLAPSSASFRSPPRSARNGGCICR